MKQTVKSNRFHELIIYKNHQFLSGENQLNLDENNEFAFKIKRKDVDNLENLYRRVKICKSCFIVYSLAARYFDSQLKKDLQGKS